MRDLSKPQKRCTGQKPYTSSLHSQGDTEGRGMPGPLENYHPGCQILKARISYQHNQVLVVTIILIATDNLIISAFLIGLVLESLIRLIMMKSVG